MIGLDARNNAAAAAAAAFEQHIVSPLNESSVSAAGNSRGVLKKSKTQQAAGDLLLLLLLLLLTCMPPAFVSHVDPLHMAARHLPRVGGVVFQGAPDRGDRGGVAREASNSELGGAGAGSGSKSVAGAAKVTSQTADEGGRLAEALGGGGAFSVENELARIQGELTALLACVIPSFLFQRGFSVLLMTLLQLQPGVSTSDRAVAIRQDICLEAHAGGGWW